jgi:hypothetical protein
VLIDREEVRSVRDVRWQELTKQECFGLLAGQHLGRVEVAPQRAVDERPRGVASLPDGQRHRREPGPGRRVVASANLR